MTTKGPPSPSLAGRVAVVSGSSQGIGAAIARELSSRGAVLVLNYPSPAQLADAEVVRDSLPTEAIAVEADMSTVDGPAALVAAAVKKFGHIDILVNNAGLGDHTRLSDMTPERWAAIFNLNARGPAFLTQAALPHLSRGGGGGGVGGSRIINIISPTSRDPYPEWTLYAGTKGALDSMTKCWARELPQEYGCTVNAVAPGPVAGSAIDKAPEVFKKRLAEFSKTTPVAPRLTQAAEVAWAVAMLCEDGAGWINGDIVNVSGGLHVF